MSLFFHLTRYHCLCQQFVPFLFFLRQRNINMWLPLMCPLLGTWPATQACALTGNRTGDPLLCRLALNPLSHTSHDCSFLLLSSIPLVYIPPFVYTLINWWTFGLFPIWGCCDLWCLNIHVQVYVSMCFHFFWVDYLGAELLGHKQLLNWPGQVTWLEPCPTHQSVTGSILWQCTYLGFRFDPWLGHVWKATDQCFSLSQQWTCHRVRIKNLSMLLNYFSKWLTVYIPTSNIWEFQLIDILGNTWYCQYF